MILEPSTCLSRTGRPCLCPRVLEMKSVLLIYSNGGTLVGAGCRCRRRRAALQPGSRERGICEVSEATDTAGEVGATERSCGPAAAVDGPPRPPAAADGPERAHDRPVLRARHRGPLRTARHRSARRDRGPALSGRDSPGRQARAGRPRRPPAEPGRPPGRAARGDRPKGPSCSSGAPGSATPGWPSN